MVDQVECRSDSEYAWRPIAIYWQEQRLEVMEIRAQWRTPQGKCFRVSVGEGQVFDLLYSEDSDAWQITPL
jgi:hypothetical protein